jgi:hypothetical protein
MCLGIVHSEDGRLKEVAKRCIPLIFELQEPPVINSSPTCLILREVSCLVVGKAVVDALERHREDEDVVALLMEEGADVIQVPPRIPRHAIL